MADTLMFFWDYDTQWGADRTRLSPPPARWGPLEFPYTDELLALHAAFGVPACFAVVGAAALPGARPYHDPAQIRRVHAAGHEIASHAMRHEWLPALDRPALLRTLRDSKDALEQCIGAPVVSFVPPYNQPFDYAGGWSFSLAERREAGPHRTRLWDLCDALRETGYRFCRVAYAPITERIVDWFGADWLGRPSFRPGPAVEIAGVTCVRVAACGFDVDRITALCRRAAAGGPVVLYGHPHSLHPMEGARTTMQAVTALRPALALARTWMRTGSGRCLRPRDLLREVAPPIVTFTPAVDEGASLSSTLRASTPLSSAPPTSTPPASASSASGRNPGHGGVA